jgi:hypothetical protein
VTTHFREARWLMEVGAPGADLPRLGRELGSLDLGALVGIAAHERALPALSARLRDAGVALPAGAGHLLRSRSMVAEFTLARLHSLLDEVVARLAAEGIDVLLLKGAALARTRYPDRLMRPMGDLDLLVRGERLARARDLLVAEGWRTPRTRAIDDVYRDHHHLPPLHDPRGAGGKLELHGDLFPKGHPFGFNAVAMWRDARRIEVGGGFAWVPTANHLLLHACVHFAWGHMLKEGAWNTFRDVCVLSAAGDLDWDAFTEEAVASKAATSCYWALFLAQHFMGAQIPKGLLVRLAPRRSAFARRRLAGHFVHQALGAARPYVTLDRAIWTLAIDPAGSAHGSARPWDHNEHFAVIPQVEQGDESLPRRLRRHLTELGRSAACLLGLAFPSQHEA